jgi:hypothetical protein
MQWSNVQLKQKKESVITIKHNRSFSDARFECSKKKSNVYEAMFFDVFRVNYNIIVKACTLYLEKVYKA